MDFTDQDIELLLKSLDTLERSEVQSEAMADMMTAVFCRGNPEAMANAQREAEKARRDKKAERQVLAERVILLKAKLVQWRQTAAAERFARE
jgi:hypothetical protein